MSDFWTVVFCFYVGRNFLWWRLSAGRIVELVIVMTKWVHTTIAHLSTIQLPRRLVSGQFGIIFHENPSFGKTAFQICCTRRLLGLRLTHLSKKCPQGRLLWLYVLTQRNTAVLSIKGSVTILEKRFVASPTGLCRVNRNDFVTVFFWTTAFWIKLRDLQEKSLGFEETNPCFCDRHGIIALLHTSIPLASQLKEGKGTGYPPLFSTPWNHFAAFRTSVHPGLSINDGYIYNFNGHSHHIPSRRRCPSHLPRSHDLGYSNHEAGEVLRDVFVRFAQPCLSSFWPTICC